MRSAHGLTTPRASSTFTRSLVGARATGADTWLVVNHLEGNVPGGVVDWRDQFVTKDDLIAALVIAP
jgi:hypothetical protein